MFYPALGIVGSIIPALKRYPTFTGGATPEERVRRAYTNRRNMAKKAEIKGQVRKVIKESKILARMEERYATLGGHDNLLGRDYSDEVKILDKLDATIGNLRTITIRHPGRILFLEGSYDKDLKAYLRFYENTDFEPVENNMTKVSNIRERIGRYGLVGRFRSIFEVFDEGYKPKTIRFQPGWLSFWETFQEKMSYREHKRTGSMGHDHGQEEYKESLETFEMDEKIRSGRY